ncbi:hypothetical protein [Labrys wisconsinensis]|uniref:AI-2E family transporter n=1 Tax=Labrys wisconsinensis TaxID=425677 RepID=A0ABU0J0F9_9HYPH|nr:hypothetical protein [Labrys wisconsinensis]MDQ0467756.1 hypothetical protein [Labrys wisconsinensis]
MKHARSFPERAERVLIAALLVGIALIAQRINIVLFKTGLGVLVVATFLQIAVGNLPKEASLGRSLVLIAVILAIVAAVFAIGIVLVPVLSQMGR